MFFNILKSIQSANKSIISSVSGKVLEPSDGRISRVKGRTMHNRSVWTPVVYCIPKQLDFKEVLLHPVIEVPFSLAHMSETVDTTEKSSLLKRLESNPRIIV